MSLAHTLRSVTVGMPHILLGGVPSVRAGEDQLSYRKLETGSVLVPIGIRSSSFEADGPLPFRCSAEGGNQSPALAWGEVPAGTQSLVLIAEDPDAPTPQPFVHWLVYNLGPALHELPERFFGAMQGKNSMFKLGFAGAAPPKGDITHHYHFQLFALDCMLPLKPGVGRSALLKAMKGHVLGQGELVGTFERRG